MASVDQGNGVAEGVEFVDVDRPLTLELSFVEAQALKAWLLNSTMDGAAAIEDPGIKPVLMKLGGALDVAEAVVSVRAELERMGFQSDHLSDEEILDFGRRVTQTSVQRLS